MLEGDPPKKNHEIREFWEQNFTILEPPESRVSELPGVFSLSLSLSVARHLNSVFEFSFLAHKGTILRRGI